MKHLYLLLIGTLILTSCVKKVDGTFEAKQDLTLYTRKGDINLATGNYSAELKLKSKKKITLVVNRNGQKLKVKFKVPRGFDIPREHGKIRLTSREVGQPYDVAANVTNSYDDSEPRHTTESCSKTFYERRCHYEWRGGETRCRTVNGRRVCHRTPKRKVRVCRDVRVERYGRRDVTYRYTGKTTEFSFRLFNPVTSEKVAQFKGNKYSSGREVLHRGPCRVNHDTVIINH